MTTSFHSILRLRGDRPAIFRLEPRMGSSHVAHPEPSHEAWTQVSPHSAAHLAVTMRVSISPIGSFIINSPYQLDSDHVRFSLEPRFRMRSADLEFAAIGVRTSFNWQRCADARQKKVARQFGRHSCSKRSLRRASLTVDDRFQSIASLRHPRSFRARSWL
jgi:hypothetical protein